MSVLSAKFPRCPKAGSRTATLSKSLILLLVALTAWACSGEDEQDKAFPTAPQRSQLAVPAEDALDVERFNAIEAVFAQIWNRVPTFSGFWYGDQGQLVIGVTDSSTASDVEHELEDVADGAYLYDRHGARRAVDVSEASRDFNLDYSSRLLSEYRHLS